LSALYLLIVAVILIVYSVAIYTNVRDQAWDHPPTIRDLGEQTTYDQAVDGVRSLIFFVDGVVFIISAGLSYLLAGYTLRPIKEALDAQSAFSADASHELRTPLAVMETGIEVLLRSKESLSEKTQKTLRSNLEEIRLMSNMTEQLLALSRSEMSREKFSEIVDLQAIVATTVERFGDIASEKHINLAITNLAPARVEGDAGNLRRMLQNIVANAIAYTPKGGAVAVSLSNEKDMGVIAVVDTGIGIAPVDIPHLFERFYKADIARTGGVSGNGLGLSIVKKIIDDHKGTIAVESELGKGTTVRIRIPLII
jgi:signal transduction histidine kinase